MVVLSWQDVKGGHTPVTADCPNNPYGTRHVWLADEDRVIARCLCCDIRVRVGRKIDVILPLERYL